MFGRVGGQYTTIEYFENDCFGYFSSENYGSVNKVYIGVSKHGILSIEKAWQGKKTDKKYLFWILGGKTIPNLQHTAVLQTER